MTLGTKSLLVLSVCAALFAACKKKDPAATGSGSATGTAAPPAVDAAAAAPAVDAAEAAPAVDAAEAAAAASMTPELKAVLDTVTPILAMSEGDARNKAACKALDTITTQMRALDKAPPAGVDQLAWTAAVEQMGGGLSDMGIECGEGESPNMKALSDLVESSKELQALAAKKGG